MLILKLIHLNNKNILDLKTHTAIDVNSKHKRGKRWKLTI
jgi:hypothetical protein